MELRTSRFFRSAAALRGSSLLTLCDVAQQLHATPAQIAIAWLLRRPPNILLIAGTSSVVHLRENVTAATIRLPDDAFAALKE